METRNNLDLGAGQRHRHCWWHSTSSAYIYLHGNVTTRRAISRLLPSATPLLLLLLLLCGVRNTGTNGSAVRTLSFQPLFGYSYQRVGPVNYGVYYWLRTADR